MSKVVHTTHDNTKRPVTVIAEYRPRQNPQDLAAKVLRAPAARAPTAHERPAPLKVASSASAAQSRPVYNTGGYTQADMTVFCADARAAASAPQGRDEKAPKRAKRVGVISGVALAAGLALLAIGAAFRLQPHLLRIFR